MKLSEIGELSLLNKIRKRFAKRSAGVLIGIGDDAAEIRPQGNMLVTTDMMVENIHFNLRFTTPYHLGFKLVSVNVSDIYAMAGTPQYILLDIAMGKNTEESFIRNFFDGIEGAADLYGASIIGGDISSSNKDMVIAATLIGKAEKTIRRSGARPGDKIYVTGYLGDSACGLEILKKTAGIQASDIGKRTISGSPQLTADFAAYGLEWKTIRPLIKRHLMPEARNPEKIAKHASSMIDVSDGLLIDLSRLCAESNTGSTIYAEHVPVSPQIQKVSSVLGIDAFNFAASGGEDYELLFTARPDFKPLAANNKLKITCIGEVTKKHRILVDKKGKRTKFRPEGYQHFGIQG